MRKISPNNQTNNNSTTSKNKTNLKDTNQHENQEDGDDTKQVQRKNSSKRQQSNPKKDILAYENEEIREITKLNSSDEYNNHILPLIIGDTVHILEENGEGQSNTFL